MVSFDLSRVSELDTSCFQILMAAKIECDKKNVEFSIKSFSPAVEEVMGLYNMNYFFGGTVVN